MYWNIKKRVAMLRTALLFQAAFLRVRHVKRP